MNENDGLSAENLDQQLESEDRRGYRQYWLVYDKLYSRDEDAHSVFGKVLSICANGSCRLCGQMPCGDDMITVAMNRSDEVRGKIWSICRRCRSRVLSDQLNGQEVAALLQTAKPGGFRRFYLWDFQNGSLQAFEG